MHGLEIEIPQQTLRLLRAFIQRRQHRGLVVIDVVARRPAEGLLLRRRQGTIPLDAALLAGLFGNERFRGAVAEGLVAAAVGVVVGRDRIQVQMREVIAEVPGPYTRHPECGQCLNFMEAQLEAFGVSERIDILVDRPGAIPGHQQRHALVQIVDHLRMPLTEHAEHRLGGLVNLLVRVAVDVDEGVLRPVGRRLSRQARELRPALEKAVEPLDLLVAPVGIRDRVDQHHQILAYAPDHRLLRYRQPIGQLQHRLRGSGLIRVKRRVEVVDRTGARPGALDCAHNTRGASASRLSSSSALSSSSGLSSISVPRETTPACSNAAQYSLLNIRSTTGRLRRMARNPRYDILFEPVKIGPVTARNRFYAVPHAAGMTNSMPHMRAKFRETKAEGGWGVVCSGYVSIDPSSDDAPLP